MFLWLEPRNILKVKTAFIRHLGRSVCKHAQELTISEPFVRRILNKDLKFHPYKKLHEGDYEELSAFDERIFDILGENDGAIVSDKARIYPYGRTVIIGPYFFEENDVTITVTSARDVLLIEMFFILDLHRNFTICGSNRTEQRHNC